MTSPKDTPIITRFSDHSKYIISKITMNGGKITYESHLHDSRKFKNARKMCPNRKIRTALTEQEIRILKNYPIETGMKDVYFGSHSIWTGSTR